VAVRYRCNLKELPQASLPATDDAIQIIGPIPKTMCKGYERGSLVTAGLSDWTALSGMPLSCLQVNPAQIAALAERVRAGLRNAHVEPTPCARLYAGGKPRGSAKSVAELANAYGAGRLPRVIRLTRS